MVGIHSYTMVTKGVNEMNWESLKPGLDSGLDTGMLVTCM